MTLPTPAAPLISVLVLNWNGAAVLPRCLDCLVAQNFTDFEVIVLDNASTDGSADDLEGRYAGLRVARLERNLGFAAGNNRGLALARGRWLACLNNDAFPQPDWLAAIARAIAAQPQRAFFASLLLDATRPDTIQAAGDAVHVSGYAWPLLAGQPLSALPDGLQEVFSACAAASVYQREAFAALGGFNESFVSHIEDVDLAFRLRLAGQRGWLVPDARVEHIQSASYGLESERTVYQVQRNSLWLYWSNMPAAAFWRCLPQHLFTSLGMLLLYLRRGRGRAALRARWDALCGLPAALRRRRQVQAACAALRAASVEAGASDDRQPQVLAAMERGWLTPFLLGRLGRRWRVRRGGR